MSNLYASNSLPGLAGSTGTRVDSSAKHIMACKVDSNMMAGWCSNGHDANNHMHVHKNKYCMTRDDLVLNVNMSLNHSSTMMRRANAYPAVVSTLGDMSTECKSLIKHLYHNSRTGRDFVKEKKNIEDLGNNPNLLKNKFQNSTSNPTKMQQEIKNLPFFMAQGYSLGIAYASALSGDTVASVLIGGMCTVQNGAFECYAGQMIQWYFEHETDNFLQVNEKQGVQGMRLLENGNKRPYTENVNDKQRKEFHNRGLGTMDGKPRGGSSDRKSNMAYPKPYILNADGSDHYGDKIRIFAKCVSGARKHEMVDLMLMTQSL
jgi:hypothetical protein